MWSCKCKHRHRFTSRLTMGTLAHTDAIELRLYSLLSCHRIQTVGRSAPPDGRLLTLSAQATGSRPSLAPRSQIASASTATTRNMGSGQSLLVSAWHLAPENKPQPRPSPRMRRRQQGCCHHHHHHRSPHNDVRLGHPRFSIAPPPARRQSRSRRPQERLWSL
jgi:hypothetical protein